MTNTQTRSRKPHGYKETAFVFDEQTIANIARAEARLEAGWKWFAKNAEHPDFELREGRWIGWLQEYEALHGARGE